MAVCGAAVLPGQQPPYPLSDYTLACDSATRQQFGLGSDQWPLTLGPDGRLYAAWGDGWGWTHEPEDPKRSMGVTRIAGLPEGLEGEDLWGIGPGSGLYKPEALVFHGDTLYLFWTSGDSRNDEDPTRLAISRDFGRNWDLGEDRGFPDAPPGFRVRSIAQQAPGDYFYVYFGRNRASDLYLARVRRARIAELGAYEWYAGESRWTAQFDLKKPAFHDPAGYIWHVGVTYDASLGRYLLTKPHFTSGDDRAVLNAADSRVGSFGLFESETPWGPWRTVHYQDDFLDALVKFSYFIPGPWISADGRTFWLAFSGWPEYDNFNLIRCRLN